MKNKLDLAELAGVTDGDLKASLTEWGYHPLTVGKIVRAVNAHEELLRMLKVAQSRYRQLGLTCDNFDRAIAKAEGK